MLENQDNIESSITYMLECLTNQDKLRLNNKGIYKYDESIYLVVKHYEKVNEVYKMDLVIVPKDDDYLYSKTTFTLHIKENHQVEIFNEKHLKIINKIKSKYKKNDSLLAFLHIFLTEMNKYFDEIKQSLIVQEYNQETLSSEFEITLELLSFALQSSKSLYYVNPYPKMYNKHNDKKIIMDLINQKRLPNNFLNWVHLRCPPPILLKDSIKFDRENNTLTIKFKINEIHNLILPEFDSLKQKHGSTTIFHGTACESAFSILFTGIEMLTDTKLMRNGGMLGKGIYLAKSLKVAQTFAKPAKLIRNNFQLEKALKLNENHKILDMASVFEFECIKMQKYIIKNNELASAEDESNYYVVDNPKHLRLKKLIIQMKLGNNANSNDKIKQIIKIMLYFILVLVLLSIGLKFIKLLIF